MTTSRRLWDRRRSHQPAASPVPLRSRSFFYRGPTGSRSANPIEIDLSCDQLSAASGHRLDVESKAFGDRLVATPAELQRLKARIQTALFLVERGQKLMPRCIQPRNLLARACGGHGLVLLEDPTTAKELALATACGHIQKGPADLVPRHSSPLMQRGQRVMHPHAEFFLQLLGEAPGRDAVDEVLESDQQGTVTGETNPFPHPESVVVPPGEFRQRVVPSGMGIAGAVVQLSQPSEHRHPGSRSEDVHHLRQAEDMLSMEGLAESIGGSRARSHGWYLWASVNRVCPKVPRCRVVRKGHRQHSCGRAGPICPWHLVRSCMPEPTVNHVILEQALSTGAQPLEVQAATFLP